MLRRLATLTLLPTFVACGGPTSTRTLDKSAPATNALEVDNGISVNGISVNGISVNGISVNGISVNGISVNGISVNGTSLGGVALDGTRLEGRDFAGATLVGMSDGDKRIALRIDSVERDSDPSNADLWLYGVSAWSDRARGWVPLCTDESGAPVKATPLAGRWDYRQGAPGGGSHLDDPGAFTFACQTYALFKCAALGYKPWLGRAAQHQACVRMLRADYCGDGRSYTVTGTEIDVWDGQGVQSRATDWPVEAEWDASGARCLAHQRYANLKPPCAKWLQEESCGANRHFDSGALLMDASVESNTKR